MRHGQRSQRLSQPSDRRKALLKGLVRSLVIKEQIQTTHARAKEAQRLADRLITWGKEGSLHSRRQAFRILQDRTLVKRLFADIAPRFVDTAGGYTRVLRLSLRRGDGAQEALLAFSRLPAPQPAVAKPPRPAPAPKGPAAPERPQPQAKKETERPKKFFEGLRSLWTRQKKGRTTP